MFLLDDILLAPLKGVVWLSKKIQDTAMEQTYDVKRFKKELADLEEQFQKGLITKEELESREKTILTSLEIAMELEKWKKE